MLSDTLIEYLSNLYIYKLPDKSAFMTSSVLDRLNPNK